MLFKCRVPFRVLMALSVTSLFAAGESAFTPGAKQHLEYKGANSEVFIDFLPDSAGESSAQVAAQMDFSAMGSSVPDGTLLITFVDKKTGGSVYMPLSFNEIRESLAGWKAPLGHSLAERNCMMVRALIKKFKPRKIDKSASVNVHGKKGLAE